MPSLFIEAESKPSVRGTDAWDSLEQIFDFLTRLLSVASQITLILNLSRSTGGLTFAIICLIKPIFNAVFTRNLWDKVRSVPHCGTFEFSSTMVAHYTICPQFGLHMSIMRTIYESLLYKPSLAKNIDKIS